MELAGVDAGVQRKVCTHWAVQDTRLHPFLLHTAITPYFLFVFMLAIT